MDQADDGLPASRGAEFEFDDGTIEVVYETVEGRILTVREYPTEHAFRRAVERASYRGENEMVSELPNVEAFEDG